MDLSPPRRVRNVSGVIPNFEAIEVIVAHWRRMLRLVLEHHADDPLADLCWIPASSCHRSILSEVGASNIPGAVHPLRWWARL